MAVLAAVATDTEWWRGTENTICMFPTTLSEHRRGKHSSGTLSHSQNSEGRVNVLLNFVRKNNPSFRLKEYFNLKCEYCHVIQIQS